MDETSATAMSVDEVGAVLEGVEGFRRRFLEPAAARPEEPFGAEVLSRLTDAAREAGILPSEAETGLALWERADDPNGLQVGLKALALLGRTSPGFAYHLHTLALGRRLQRSLRIDGDGVVPWVEGGNGLAKGRLAPFLLGRAPAEDPLLSGFFRTDSSPSDSLPLLLRAGEPWSRLVLPVLEAKEMAWAVAPREALALDPLAAPHGLDEVAAYAWRLREKGALRPIRTLAGGEARSLFMEALALQSLAGVAIGLGAAGRGLARSIEQAQVRRQGGGLLQRHAAIQLLLGQQSAALSAVEAMLEGLAPPLSTPAPLARALGIRAAAHPMLSSAGNAALQIFGGYGYMRDYGLEKIVRDLNQLRLLGASPGDVRLFLAQYETARCE